MKVDQMKGVRHPFTYKMLKRRVENEKDVINNYKPEAIVIGTTLSMFITSKVCEIPLVYIKPLAYTRTYFLHGHLELPTILNKFFIPGNFIKKLYQEIALKITYKPKAFSKVAKEENVRLPKYTIDALDADYNLITTLPQISGIDCLPDNYTYIGPVYAKLENNIPKFIESLSRDNPIVYFAMGSSGGKDMVIKVLKALEKLSVTVICPMKDTLGSSVKEFAGSNNIHLCDLIPAHKISDIIDLSIIHGGEGTVQTACLTGKPFIGIGLQQEQTANINDCVIFGNALELKKRDISAKKISKLMNYALTNKEIQRKAKLIQEIFEKEDGPANAARFLINKFH
ncbi:glycosyltransferase [Priestia aryabhattai]